MEEKLSTLKEDVSDEQLLAVIADPGLADVARRQGFTSASHSDRAREHLAWAKREQLVQVTPADLPAGILPEGHSARLIDIKVKPKGKVRTDDEVYLQNPVIREKVPRGTCLFQLDSAGHDNMCCSVFSLRKFTGGLGDDDDVETADQADWKQYFLEPFESATHFVSMAKANGEAAHLGVRWMLDRFVLFIGSKNVHLAACARRDIARYKDERFMVAKQIAEYMFEVIDAMDEAKRTRLLAFLAASRLTATFEFLQVCIAFVFCFYHSVCVCVCVCVCGCVCVCVSVSFFFPPLLLTQEKMIFSVDQQLTTPTSSSRPGSHAATASRPTISSLSALHVPAPSSSTSPSSSYNNTNSSASSTIASSSSSSSSSYTGPLSVGSDTGSTSGPSGIKVPTPPAAPSPSSDVSPASNPATPDMDSLKDLIK